MKTSNKILIGSFLGSLLFAFGFMGYLKANFVEYHALEGDGDVTTKTVNFKKLNELEIGVGKIYLVKTNGDPKLEITYKEGLEQYFNEDFDFETGVYKIYRNSGVFNELNFTMHFYVNDHPKIFLTQDAELFVEEQLELDSLDIELYGNSSADLDLDIEKLTITANNSSKVHLNGVAKNFDIRVNNAARVRGMKFKSNEVMAKVNNAGKLDVHPIEKFDVQVNNAGQVRYTGEPDKIYPSVNNAGRLEKIEPKDDN